MKCIEATSNNDIKHLIKLKKKNYRREHQQFVAEGMRTCATLTSKFEPVAIYMTLITYDMPDRPDFPEDKIFIVIPSVMEKICSTMSPSGICAVFKIPKTNYLPENGPGIVLVDIKDPGNIGTLIRTAAAMNIKEVIIIGGVDPYHPKVVQATAGNLCLVNIYTTSFPQLKLRDGLKLCALVATEGDNPKTTDLSNSFLIVGNESRGLSQDQIEACDQKITIPMPGNTESLNAAVAGSIGLYLMTQQK